MFDDIGVIAAVSVSIAAVTVRTVTVVAVSVAAITIRAVEFELRAIGSRGLAVR